MIGSAGAAGEKIIIFHKLVEKKGDVENNLLEVSDVGKEQELKFQLKNIERKIETIMGYRTIP